MKSYEHLRFICRSLKKPQKVIDKGEVAPKYTSEHLKNGLKVPIFIEQMNFN